MNKVFTRRPKRKWVQYSNEKENVGKHNLLSVLRDKKAILKEISMYV